MTAPVDRPAVVRPVEVLLGEARRVGDPRLPSIDKLATLEPDTVVGVCAGDLLAAAARLVALTAAVESLTEQLGTERLVHHLQEQRLAESGSFKGAPRWDEDRIVIEHGWLDGRCGRCGEALPKTAALEGRAS